jgi:hypothetical protein
MLGPGLNRLKQVETGSEVGKEGRKSKKEGSKQVDVVYVVNCIDISVDGKRSSKRSAIWQL